jgi:putative phosphoribosyl transferase
MNQRQDTIGWYKTPAYRRWLFRDRSDAGRQLSAALLHYASCSPLVLGIANGGVEVAREVARGLNAELQVLVVRKLSIAPQLDLALGAVASDGPPSLNQELLSRLSPGQAWLDRASVQQSTAANHQQLRLQRTLPPLDVAGRTIILIDDGLATGATLRAALRFLRSKSARSIVVAVPVADAATADAIASEADEFVCPQRVHPLLALGVHYQKFPPVSEANVERLLREHRAERTDPP